MILPNHFPDELLFSRLVRLITLSGEGGASFNRKVFDDSRKSIHPFLTAGLIQLAHSTGDCAEDLLYQQTLAPLFMFFLPNHALRLEQLMMSSEGAKVIRESQLPSFGGGNTIFLKWCPKCAELDLSLHGVSYWHRAHQIPGIIACHSHGILLGAFSLGARQRLSSGLLPDLSGGFCLASSAETKVAKFSAELLQMISNKIEYKDIATIYRDKLSDDGLVSYHRRIRMKALMVGFNRFLKGFETHANANLPHGVNDYKYISQLLECNSNHHPFRHLLFSTWLFGAPEFMLYYRRKDDVLEIKNKNTKRENPYEDICLKLLKKGFSLAKIYRLTGKSRCYLKRLATLNDINIVTKPRVLTEQLVRGILYLGRLGFHRKYIAIRYGIGVGSVEQVISSHPGLVEYRIKCHNESMHRRCILKILRFRQIKPESCRVDIKSGCNKEYHWLYLHDKSVLEAILPRKIT